MLRITGSSKLGFFLFVWNYEKIHIMGIFYIFQKSFLGGLEYEVQEAIKGYILVHTVMYNSNLSLSLVFSLDNKSGPELTLYIYQT